jgi:hypothetical protein
MGYKSVSETFTVPQATFKNHVKKLRKAHEVKINAARWQTTLTTRSGVGFSLP